MRTYGNELLSTCEEALQLTFTVKENDTRSIGIQALGMANDGMAMTSSDSGN